MRFRIHNIGARTIAVAAAFQLSGLMGLVGCAQVEPARDVSGAGVAAVVEAKAPPPSSEAVSLLYYAQSIRAMSGKDLADETDRVRLAYATEKSDLYMLQYVLALSVSSASVANQRRALQLLEAFAAPADGRNSELQTLAALLRADIAERRRLEDIAYGQTQKLREEQRRNEELDKKVEALTKKLEALINIERNLLHRDKSQTPGGHK